MRSLIIAALAATSVAALAGATSSPAEARDYAYCLQGRQQGYPGACDYTSFQQCKAAASGTESDCGINPRFAFGNQGRSYYHAYPYNARAQW
ncbi:hypothetical protein HNR60_000546 [Rhodopseudomonas rhenobacensis]|uniref:DUF3551 domain-containing protein n=1 Tax=Rhodopseudomonas rhenobacensis TaxID=87461 RepID=A0A7W7Z0R6_9BRAD|nr:DUF3551 domain-containing protein [Rhodopseudomonas rhenobacensis]MBB5045811.1 hypothetical protein [Rhodopseudomonas rhenobacensis]